MTWMGTTGRSWLVVASLCGRDFAADIQTMSTPATKLESKSAVVPAHPDYMRFRAPKQVCGKATYNLQLVRYR